ncbi:hypothetical protein V501_09349 [Pseudogymnoascus sp. VKM F-4519 (FW-2642)]|nr:hypothetical protein V501_09349 [Pseudogymnoascus sp. VKM F-4519 (FW-2642)]
MPSTTVGSPSLAVRESDRTDSDSGYDEQKGGYLTRRAVLCRRQERGDSTDNAIPVASTEWRSMSDSADPMPTAEDATRRRRLCLHYWECRSTDNKGVYYPQLVGIMGFVGMWEEGRGGMKGQRTLVVSHVPARRVSKHASASSTNDGYSIVPPATDGLPARKPMMGKMTSGEWMTVDDRVETERSTVLCDERFNSDLLHHQPHPCPVLCYCRCAVYLPITKSLGPRPITQHHTIPYALTLRQPVRQQAVSGWVAVPERRDGGTGHVLRHDQRPDQTFLHLGRSMQRSGGYGGETIFGDYLGARDKYECATANVGAPFVSCSAGV